MSDVTLYGIKACDTMKKAFNWLDDHKIDYVFHDYKKQGIDTDALRLAIAQHGWDTAINRRGTTWRKLPEDVKNAMDESKAIDIAVQNPSIVKRPLLVVQGESHLGFKEEAYKEIFKR